MSRSLTKIDFSRVWNKIEKKYRPGGTGGIFAKIFNAARGKNTVKKYYSKLYGHISLISNCLENFDNFFNDELLPAYEKKYYKVLEEKTKDYFKIVKKAPNDLFFAAIYFIRKCSRPVDFDISDVPDINSIMNVKVEDFGDETVNEQKLKGDKLLDKVEAEINLYTEQLALTLKKIINKILKLEKVIFKLIEKAERDERGYVKDFNVDYTFKSNDVEVKSKYIKEKKVPIEVDIEAKVELDVAIPGKSIKKYEDTLEKLMDIWVQKDLKEFINSKLTTMNGNIKMKKNLNSKFKKTKYRYIHSNIYIFNKKIDDELHNKFIEVFENILKSAVIDISIMQKMSKIKVENIKIKTDLEMITSKKNG